MKKKTSGVFKVVTVIFCIYMLILLIPYVYALFASVSTYQEYYFNLFPIPRGGLQWKNYVDAWLNLQHDIFGRTGGVGKFSVRLWSLYLCKVYFSGKPVYLLVRIDYNDDPDCGKCAEFFEIYFSTWRL